MNNKVKKTAAMILTASILLTGCGSTAAELKTIKHIDGTELSVPVNVERIGAIYGPSYEALVALGAEDKIVVCADVQFKNFPWAQKIFKHISKLPYLKNVHSSVNLEELESYAPDLVYTFNRPNELKQLNAAGISNIGGLTTSTLSDTKDQLMVYAEAIGEDAKERAQKYADYFDKKLKMVTDITDQIPKEDKPTVYYAGIDMLTTYGKYSDLSQVITAAGGISVTSELQAGNHTQINFEQLAEWNPDCIFIDHGGMNEKDTVSEIMDGTYKNKKYSAINAVKNQKIYLTPSGVFYWDMGLQKILLVMYMAKILHPEEFASLDMNQELRDFYSQFYDYNLTKDEANDILNRIDPK